MTKQNVIGKSTKTNEDFFRDWEGEAFGFGYGTGEAVILPLLRRFFSHCNRNDSTGYRYEEIEKDIGKETTWFLINVFGKNDIIEYGSSPRFGWLTTEGCRLKEFVTSKTDQELYDIVMADDSEREITHCSRGACNCGPGGYQKGILCPNPFWPDRVQHSSLDKE